MSTSSLARTPQTRSQTKKGVTTRTPTLRQSSDIPQATVILNLTISLVLLTALSVGYWKYNKSILQVPRLPLVIDRLIYTLQLQTYSLIPLLLSLSQVMLTRLFTGAINPLSGNEKSVEKPIRILTNTVEQLLFNLLNQLILVTFIPADYLLVIPFLVFVFTIGRIAFLIGYSVHPKFRTYGFILTFFPSFLIMIANLTYVTGLNRYISLPLSSEQVKKVEL